MTRRTAAAHAGDRDALTFSNFSGLAMWAWFLYGFGSMLPLLRAEQGTSRTVMGLHSFALSLGAIIAGLAVVPLVARLQRRGVALTGTSMLTAGTAVLCLVLPPWATLPAVLLIGTGGSMVINSITAAVTQHHGPSGAAILSEGNAVAALVGLVAPLSVGVASAAGLTWRPALLAVLPLAGLFAWLLHRVPRGWPELDGEPPAHPPAEQRRADRLPLGFWLLLCAIMATVAVEFCCTAWSADLLRQSTPLSAGSASAAVSLFVGGLFVGRTVAGRFARRRRPEPILAVGILVVLAGWVVLWTAHASLPGLVGMALLGLGVSVQYPLTAALAYASVPGGGDRVSAALSLGVGTAAGLAPFTIGAVADASSTHAAFVLVPVMAVVALAMLGVRQYYAARPATADRV